MIYDGVITKPPLDEVIEHGWGKDAAAKIHKYIKRWKNKAGKWVYQYKNEIRDKRVANKRKEAGLTAPEWVSFNIMGKKLGAGPKGGIIAVRSDNGKPKSYGHNERRAARSRSTDQLKNALDSGRKRAAKKGYAVQGYRGKTGSNLSSRGYSSSRGSGESKRQRNLGTRNVAGSNRHGTTVRIKDPNYIPQFESLSGPADDGYTFTDSGWYWRGKHINNVLDSQNRNSVKIKVYKTKNGRKSKTRR